MRYRDKAPGSEIPQKKKGCVHLKYIRNAALLLFGMLPCLFHPTFASDVSVTLNDAPLSFDAAPIIENDRVLVPMRGILESLGYSVTWEQSTQTVTAKKDTLSITLPLGSDTALINGSLVSIDAPAKLHQERTFVPLRFLAEYSGAEVLWDGATATVSIYTEPRETAYDIRDSVVMIQTNKIMGSGVVLSEDGLIATNFHVIENASVAQIIFQDNSLYFGDITVVGLNPEADIALLQIQKNGLTPAQTSTKLTVGEAVTAVGSPYGNKNKMTTGKIVSFDQDIISSSAEIAKGSSGGGLFNAAGQLIGISSAMGNEQYLSIPIALVEAVPRNLSIPLLQIAQYQYMPHAPQNLRYWIKDGYAMVTWSPIYNADYFYTEVAPAKDGPFERLENRKNGQNYWYWGHPQCFGISIHPGQEIYMRVTAVVNGVATETSEVLRITR